MGIEYNYKSPSKDRFFMKWRYQCKEAIKELSKLNECNPLKTIDVLESFIASSAVELANERVDDGAKD